MKIHICVLCDLYPVFGLKYRSGLEFPKALRHTNHYMVEQALAWSKTKQNPLPNFRLLTLAPLQFKQILCSGTTALIQD